MKKQLRYNTYVVPSPSFSCLRSFSLSLPPVPYVRVVDVQQQHEVTEPQVNTE
jgi:hypothetical protein